MANDITAFQKKRELPDSFLEEQKIKNERELSKNEIIQITIPFTLKEYEIFQKKKINLKKELRKKDIFKIRQKIEIDTSIKIEKTGKNIKRILIRITQQEKMNLNQNCNLISIPIFLKYLILTETNLLQ